MKVTLIEHTSLETLMKAARTSHSSRHLLDTIKDVLGMSDRKLLKRLIQSEHLSVFEHLTYSFDISDISRALLQELSRHRHLSLLVKSTRFTLRRQLARSSANKPQELVEEFCVVPPIDDPNLKQEVIHRMYEMLIVLKNSTLPNDHLKYLLPECFKTDLVLTANARALAYVITLRSQPDVLWEFRQLVTELYKIVHEVHPILWEEFKEHFDMMVEV